MTRVNVPPQHIAPRACRQMIPCFSKTKGRLPFSAQSLSPWAKFVKHVFQCWSTAMLIFKKRAGTCTLLDLCTHTPPVPSRDTECFFQLLKNIQKLALTSYPHRLQSTRSYCHCSQGQWLPPRTLQAVHLWQQAAAGKTADSHVVPPSLETKEAADFHAIVSSEAGEVAGLPAVHSSPEASDHQHHSASHLCPSA